MYAPTPAISDFVEDVEAQDEAVGYVSVGQYQQVTATDDSPGQSLIAPASTLSTSSGARRPESASHEKLGSTPKRLVPLGMSPSNASGPSKLPASPSRQHMLPATASTTPHPSPTSAGRWAWHPHATSLTRSRIVQLYTSLRPGLPLRNWCIENETLLSGVDVRRFITFGVIKGFLYRVHRWGYVNFATMKVNGVDDLVNGAQDDDNAEKIARWDAQIRHGGSSGNSVDGSITKNGTLNGDSMHGQGMELSRARLAEATRDLPLTRYLDGLHCFDEVCTELQMNEKVVLDRMRSAYGDLQIISR